VDNTAYIVIDGQLIPAFESEAVPTSDPRPKAVRRFSQPEFRSRKNSQQAESLERCDGLSTWDHDYQPLSDKPSSVTEQKKITTRKRPASATATLATTNVREKVSQLVEDKLDSMRQRMELHSKDSTIIAQIKEKELELQVLRVEDQKLQNAHNVQMREIELSIKKAELEIVQKRARNTCK